MHTAHQYDTAIYYNNEGNRLYSLGKLNEALSAYDKAIALDPSNGAYHNNKGNTLDALGEVEAALAAYEQATQLDPYRACYYNNKANALYKNGQVEAALEASGKTIQLEPDKAEYYYNRAKFLCFSGQRKAALEHYDQAIRLSPTTACYYYTKAKLLFVCGKIEPAILLYNKAIELDPTNPEYYREKGCALFDLNQNEDALAVFKRVIELDPKNAEAYKGMGVCLVEMGKFNEAINAYDEAIQLGHRRAFTNKGFALYKLGDINGAIKLYDKQAEIYPDGWASYAKKGKALNDMNKVPEAMEHFRKALDIINQGKLEDRLFIFKGRATVLSLFERNLIKNIQTLNIPILNPNKALSKELKAKAEGLNAEREGMNTRLIACGTNEELQQEVKEIKKWLRISGVIEIAITKEAIQELKGQDPEVFVYFKAFYWTVIHLFSVYSNGNEDPVKKSLKKSNVNDILEGLGIAKEFVLQLAQAAPLIGPGLNALNFILKLIYGGIQERKLKNKVVILYKIIEAKCTMVEELNVKLASVAVVVTQVNKQAILHPNLSPPKIGKMKAAWDWLTAPIEKIKEIIPSEQLYDKNSFGATLALKHVTLFMMYLFKYYEEIIESKDALDVQFQKIFSSEKIYSLLEDVRR